LSAGIGIDLLEIDRMERALARRPQLADRLFTAGEREHAHARGQVARHLAARFCAKEAVAKALDLRVWNPHDVEVVPTGGAPEVRLSGHAAARAAELGVQEVRLSLTHSRGMAGAVAVTG
jgi:holo-[acyl-carrier protein] synthase